MCFNDGSLAINNYYTRSCIGQRFAKLELFSLMVKVLQNYRLEYADEEDIGIQTKFVTIPDRQVKIKFYKRK